MHDGWVYRPRSRSRPAVVKRSEHQIPTQNSQWRCQQKQSRMLLAPLGVLLLLGFVLAILNGVATDRTTVVGCVAVIIMFGVDPLFGLQTVVFSPFGASVVYIIILQAGFDGYDVWFQPSLPSSVTGCVLCRHQRGELSPVSHAGPTTDYFVSINPRT